MVYIEPILLSTEKKDEYVHIRNKSIVQSARFKMFSISRTERKDSSGETKFYEEIKYEVSESLTSIIKEEISHLVGNFLEEKLAINVLLNEYRLRTDELEWPTVLLYVPSGDSLSKVEREIARLGYSFVENTYEGREPPHKKLYIFNLVHIRIPPEIELVKGFADVYGVAGIYDGDKRVGIPDPTLVEEISQAELNDSVKLIWPPDAKIPDDMPAPGKGIKVCILDTGVDNRHPDLEGRVSARRDFTEEANNIDANGHGTHCAGIAGGSGTASGGKYRGVAPFIEIIAAKVLNQHGIGKTSDVLVAMRWAYDQGADVLSMSLGASGVPTDGQSIITRACTTLDEKGMIICVSAGNSGPGLNTITVPADSPGVIATGAIGKDRKIATFSSRGPTDSPQFTGNKPDVVAPGVAIVACRSGHCELSAYRGNLSYTELSGTSMACPHAAGAAAVVASYAKSLGLTKVSGLVRQVLQDTCVPIPGYDNNDQGRGIVNIPQALFLIREHAPTAHQVVESPSKVQAQSESMDSKVRILRMIEIRDELKRIQKWWVGNEYKRDAVKDILKRNSGELKVSDRAFLSYFRTQEEAEEFVRMYAIAYGCSFNNSILTEHGGEEETDSTVYDEEIAKPVNENGLDNTDLDILENEIRKRAIISIKDFKKYRPEREPDYFRALFQQKAEANKNLLIVLDSLVCVPKLDSSYIEKEIREKVMQTHGSVTLGENVFIKPDELRDVVTKLFPELAGIDNKKTVELLRRVFEGNKRIALSESEIRYIL